MDFEGKVGYAFQTEGAKGPIRLDRFMEAVTVEGRGKYAEATAKGTVFTLTLPSTSGCVALGNIISSASSQVTQFALWNPMGSGKNIELLKFEMAIVSGSPAAGPLFHGIIFGSMGTSVTSSGSSMFPNDVSGAPASVARFISSAPGVIFAGGPAPQVLRLADVTSTATVIAENSTIKAVEYIDGDIVLTPGTGWLPLWSGQATNFQNSYSITWTEITIPN
jgi:hypothetical protein